MKFKILVFVIILIPILTSCVSTDKADINEFINRYNSVSDFLISKTKQTIIVNDDSTVHRFILNENIILALTSNKYSEITECSISTPIQNVNNNFKDVCAHTLSAITNCNKTNADKAIKEAFTNHITLAECEIYTNTDNVQTTVIIRLLTETENINPTLKEFLKQINY